MNKLISFSIMCLIALSINAQFVDLGLPSGTKWKNNSERGTYAFAQAVRYYDGFLPTSGQFKELVDNCIWTWVGTGYKVAGRNGNYIFLPVEFERGDDHLGAFWSITKDENGCCYVTCIKSSFTLLYHMIVYAFSDFQGVVYAAPQAAYYAISTL